MNKKRLAVFASGKGSNFQKIQGKIIEGFIPASVELVLTDNPKAGVIEIAKCEQISVQIISPKNFADAVVFNEKILSVLIKAEIDYIILAGYLKLIGQQIINRFYNKIINIHPALLPSFGGKGMYGHHVHDAVFASGVKVSGATVHIVNPVYDSGPIIMQKCVDISRVRSAEEIAQKVLKIEHEIYPLAVKLLVEEKLSIHGNRVEILGDSTFGTD